MLGVFGQEGLITDAAEYLKDVGAPPETIDAVTSALASAQSQRSTAVTALVFGLVTALYGASGAFGSVGAALNHVWRVEEGRGFVKHKLHNLMWTILIGVLVLFTFVLVFLGGGLARDVLGADRARRERGRDLGRSRAGRRRCSRRCSSTRSCTTPRRTSRYGAGNTSPPAPSSA